MINIIKQNFKCGVIAGANNTKKLTIDSNEKNIFPMTLEESWNGDNDTKLIRSRMEVLLIEFSLI